MHTCYETKQYVNTFKHAACLRYYNKKKNTDKAKSCLGLKLRNFTIESIQTKAKLCSKYMCQFEAYKSRMLSTSNQGSSDLTRQIVGRPV